MLEGWLGHEPLSDTLRAHVGKHAWGVTDSDGFVATLGESLGPDAARVFRGYIDQPGVPRVAAGLQCKPGASSPSAPAAPPPSSSPLLRGRWPPRSGSPSWPT